LLRFDADGKPANWPGTDSNRLQTRPWRSFGVGLGQRGMTVGLNGDLYFIRNSGDGGTFSRVDVFAPDGKLKRAAMIDGMGVGDCGIGVDAAGNVYVGANVKPAEHLVPDDFAGKVPTIDWLCWAQWKWHYRPPPWHYMMRNEYLYHWGSVFKFGPAGGAFYGRGSRVKESRGTAKTASLANAPAGGPKYLSGYLYYDVTVDGAKWRYPGMGIVPASERYWGDPSCVCMTSRLAVDPYGRVYLPNVFRFCVEATDTAGNRLCRVGEYGNADDRGPAPYFAWPAFVGVDESRLYVSDSVNRRVTVLKLTAAAEASCAVK